MHVITQRMRLCALVASLSMVAACKDPYRWDGSLESMMRSQPERFETVMADPEKYRVQIIYTQIDREADGKPIFQSYTYRLDANEYFYPASTVKLPAAIRALENLKMPHLFANGIGRSDEMVVGDADVGQSIERHIQDIAVVSDNDAYNQLYDFVGLTGLNILLSDQQWPELRITHRLGVPLTVEENRVTGPLRFKRPGMPDYERPAVKSRRDYSAPDPVLLGRAEIVDGERVEGPKDFSTKNAYPLQAQHDVIKALMFPDSLLPEHRFGLLTPKDYDFLRKSFSTYPRESGIPEYQDAERYPDGYVKFLMYGGDEPRIPDNIRIFNKVGDAYGFLTDAAYIVDFENNIEFMLAATIYVNDNETFNDDVYEYDEIGFPFLRHLGQAIYEIELERERAYSPDLTHLQFDRP